MSARGGGGGELYHCATIEGIKNKRMHVITRQRADKTDEEKIRNLPWKQGKGVLWGGESGGIPTPYMLILGGARKGLG